MSTGISISSINRIKELAEAKRFEEALEILDTQNLDKSINPQFLRISGEIFRENKRYYDSRRILLKAHQMAPQGNRIIYELIRLYLELGYYSKAQIYYEQYMFYTTPDDTQKDYVEYLMKKSQGEDIKTLASILIPILERMPEDKWNFEAVLLYHKLGRKDKALEESQYILENFKESQYIQPVIDYIEDKLDVDQFFYTYPDEEQPEDVETFGDLLELEAKILEADNLRIHPPEARIMVEVEDKEGIDAPPVKDKKPKKTKKKKKSSQKEKGMPDGVLDGSDVVNVTNTAENSLTSDDSVAEDSDVAISGRESNKSEDSVKENDEDIGLAASDIGHSSDDDLIHDEEERLKNEREAALDMLLSKKIDTEKVKESAKQVAKVVKEIDADKAKEQMKVVAETVKDNVKKATDVLGEAVGAKQILSESKKDFNGEEQSQEELIVDGIIESVLEPPKKTVGQVITNEELDALIPDSLEAMSEEEVTELEAKKEEEKRLETEALEAKRKYDEEKKLKKRREIRAEKADNEKNVDIVEIVAEDDSFVELNEQQVDDNVEKSEAQQLMNETGGMDNKKNQDVKFENDVVDKPVKEKLDDRKIVSDNNSYTELKNQYIKDLTDMDEQPLDSLGFISVVRSDVDKKIEDEIPETADMLKELIGDKEFYADESSLGFESKASYQNPGFEIEDFEFDLYKSQQENEQEEKSDVLLDEPSPVQVIFAQEKVVAFEDMIPEINITISDAEHTSYVDEKIVGEKITKESVQEKVILEKVEEESIPEEIIPEKVEEESISEDIIPEKVEKESIPKEIIPEKVEEESIPEEIIPEKVEESVPKEIIPEKVEEESIPEEFVNEKVSEELLDEEFEKQDIALNDSSPEIHFIDDTVLSYQEQVEELISIDGNKEEQTSGNSQETIEHKRMRLRGSVVLSIRLENKLLELKESR